MANRLITLSNMENLRALRSLYKANGLTQILGYQMLDNYINWFERDPHQKHINVYTLPEVWRKSGLYLIVDRYQLLVNALGTKDAVEELQLAIPQLDWSRGYKMTGAPAIHYETILKILSDMQLQIVIIVQLHVMQIPREQALKIDLSPLPDEYEFRALQLEDAAIVNNTWHSVGNGTIDYIKRLITYNNNIGIYLKSTGELIAWCIRCNLGLLGMLHVKAAYRGRGLARTIVQHLSRQIAEAGENVSTMINEKNLHSVKLFTKLGFNEIGTTFVIGTRCNENSEMWSEEQESKWD